MIITRQIIYELNNCKILVFVTELALWIEFNRISGSVVDLMTVLLWIINLLFNNYICRRIWTKVELNSN